jgi:hypothetical protein
MYPMRVSTRLLVVFERTRLRMFTSVWGRIFRRMKSGYTRSTGTMLYFMTLSVDQATYHTVYCCTWYWYEYCMTITHSVTVLRHDAPAFADLCLMRLGASSAGEASNETAEIPSLCSSCSDNHHRCIRRVPNIECFRALDGPADTPKSCLLESTC